MILELELPILLKRKEIQLKRKLKLKTGATVISYKFGHKVAPHALSHWLLSIVLTSSVGIELLSSSAIVTSVKSQKGLGLSDLERPRPIDRTRDTWVR